MQLGANRGSLAWLSAAARGGVLAFLTRTRGRRRLHWTDWLSYGYLLLGVLLMFGPVLWVALSSFKTQAQLLEFPPAFLPYGQVSAEVEGHDQPLPLFRVRLADGSERVMAQVRRVGIQSQLVDPAAPDDADQGQHRRARAGAPLRDGLEQLHRPVPAVQLRPLPVEQRVHHRGRDDHHAGDQLDGGVRALQIRLPGAHHGVRADHRDPDDPADDRARADLPRGLAARPAQQRPGA